ncbi:hypothetical protein AVEN_239833-1 [Araneus ventricosus]|uniref:Uncharacterized protein n=1 Tax=Araneus ventricosus TaxID=182803 RepID=A0A4Y2ND83_ARAVE|nr:hypothetical protein AVEN_239833-1 [Araneus ventricosus]
MLPILVQHFAGVRGNQAFSLEKSELGGVLERCRNGGGVERQRADDSKKRTCVKSNMASFESSDAEKGIKLYAFKNRFRASNVISLSMRFFEERICPTG